MHIYKIVCYCDFKTQHFRCVQIICIFYKCVCTKITIFFHFFQTIASCDHQSTSGHLAGCPFSLLLAILSFSYDFNNNKYLQIKYFNITFCLETDILGFCKHVLLAYFGEIYLFRTNFMCFKELSSMFTACNGIPFSWDFDTKCDVNLAVSILPIDNSLLCSCVAYCLFCK